MLVTVGCGVSVGVAVLIGSGDNEAVGGCRVGEALGVGVDFGREVDCSLVAMVAERLGDETRDVARQAMDPSSSVSTKK